MHLWAHLPQVLCVLSLALLHGAFALKWTDLTVTYSPMPELLGFNKIPRLKSDAEQKHWVSINSDCSNSGKFNGFRYILGTDPSVVIIYDVKGFIAGIQIMTLRSDALSTGVTDDDLKAIAMYQTDTFNGKEYMVETAYFVNPNIICSKGRTQKDFDKSGTGDGVWFQNGPTPKDMITVPKKREDAIKEKWTENACFPGMGVHNFYDVSTWDSSNCTRVRPAFLLFTKTDELQGFGFVIPGKTKAPFLENPPYEAIKEIITPDIPKCVEKRAKDGTVTLHVYFLDNPQDFKC